MKRRNFIRISGLTTISTGLINAYLNGSRSENILEDKTLALICEPTTADILGPFYRSNSPLRSNIVPEDDPDQNTILMSGKVLTNDCSPIEGASVEIWQAGGNGQYDNSSAEFKYRGTFISNADGSYFFNTIVPGHYLNGSQFRPAHLHFRITKPGYKSVVTQIYFEGDEYIPSDQWASAPSATMRIIPLVEVNNNQFKYELSYDFSLDIITGLQPDLPAFAKNIQYNNPFVSSINIQSETNDLSILAAEILDLQGRLVLSRYRINEQNLIFRTEALRAGLYFLRLKTSQGIGVFRIVKTE